MDIRAAEISAILKEQIRNFGQEAEVTEVGQVLSVGDGIARCYGLDNVQAGEMVQFESGVQGMALNLATDNVGIVIFGDDRGIREGDTVTRTGDVVSVPVGPPQRRPRPVRRRPARRAAHPGGRGHRRAELCCRRHLITEISGWVARSVCVNT